MEPHSDTTTGGIEPSHKILDSKAVDMGTEYADVHISVTLGCADNMAQMVHVCTHGCEKESYIHPARLMQNRNSNTRYARDEIPAVSRVCCHKH